jgi:hypothetical protein
MLVPTTSSSHPDAEHAHAQTQRTCVSGWSTASQRVRARHSSLLVVPAGSRPSAAGQECSSRTCMQHRHNRDIHAQACRLARPYTRGSTHDRQGEPSLKRRSLSFAPASSASLLRDFAHLSEQADKGGGEGEAAGGRGAHAS